MEDQTKKNTPNLSCVAAHPSCLDLSAHVPGEHGPVRVVCHRGDWRNFVENSLEAVESCIEMGADIVEVDIWRTKDGHFILMHDETLDRTTNGHGLVADFTLDEIRALRLKDGLGNMTEYTIPTVDEVLQLAKDRIIVNLDKADVYFDEVYVLLLRYGMVNQTILKSTTPFRQLREKWGDVMDHVVFMPIIDIDETTTIDHLQAVFAEGHRICEINFVKDDDQIMTAIRKMAAENSTILWANAIWPTTCGGHSDDRALKDKDSNWGYLVRNIGAGIIQTDRPAALLEYLNVCGWR